MSEFTVKDSGERAQFASGMVRDVTTGKTQWARIFDGPMAQRWAEHLTKGAAKYPDVAPGVPNWTLASGAAELARFRESAVRHFIQWYQGDTDEDHGAATLFNINGAEYVKNKLAPPMRVGGVQHKVRDMDGAIVPRVAAERPFPYSGGPGDDREKNLPDEVKAGHGATPHVALCYNTDCGRKACTKCDSLRIKL